MSLKAKVGMIEGKGSWTKITIGIYLVDLYHFHWGHNVMLDNFKAIRDIQRIKMSGGTAELSVAQITNLIVNLQDARKNLSESQFNEVYTIFQEMQQYTAKMEMDIAGYLDTAMKIIRRFDEVAPYEKYSGNDEEECALMMEDIRSDNVRENMLENIHSESFREEALDYLKEKEHQTENPGKESIEKAAEKTSDDGIMTILDAFQIVDDFVDALAKEPRPGESWKRKSELKNSVDEINAAIKLIFAHAIFWSSVPHEDLKLLELSYIHIWDFVEDDLVEELARIDNILEQPDQYIKREKEVVVKVLSEKRSQFIGDMSQSRMERFKKDELGDFISWVNEQTEKVKMEARTLSDEEYDFMLPAMIDDYVREMYGKAQIKSDDNSGKYFWPFEMMLKYSEVPGKAQTYARYKNYLEELALRYPDQQS